MTIDLPHELPESCRAQGVRGPTVRSASATCPAYPAIWALPALYL